MGKYILLVMTLGIVGESMCFLLMLGSRLRVLIIIKGSKGRERM